VDVGSDSPAGAPIRIVAADEGASRRTRRRTTGADRRCVSVTPGKRNTRDPGGACGSDVGV